MTVIKHTLHNPCCC